MNENNLYHLTSKENPSETYIGLAIEDSLYIMNHQVRGRYGVPLDKWVMERNYHLTPKEGWTEQMSRKYRIECAKIEMLYKDHPSEAMYHYYMMFMS